ncbi:hypothetical protein PILCRDRAFT_8092 [Piloderma croceum F 1598]|uniref:Uncharacterized protein n=1 Tax=Piloderma croceum (strain F 1598) TaxID=765440 RepID=A0A0C3FRD3_PILCF|nr:hypothetical protein PILCRDRAFT_8092 [Piloderma croceum F 1598]
MLSSPIKELALGFKLTIIPWETVLQLLTNQTNYASWANPTAEAGSPKFVVSNPESVWVDGYTATHPKLVAKYEPDEIIEFKPIPDIMKKRPEFAKFSATGDVKTLQLAGLNSPGAPSSEVAFTA